MTMPFLFVRWLQQVSSWRPPGSFIDGVCQLCEESPLRDEAIFDALPHDLLHGIVTDFRALAEERYTVLVDEYEAVWESQGHLWPDRPDVTRRRQRQFASLAESLALSEVAAIASEVAAMWEQHASPRLLAWVAYYLEELLDEWGDNLAD